MSKHHHAPRRWQEFVQKGRRPRPAAAAGGAAGAEANPEQGGKHAGTGAARPSQPLRRPRAAKPPKAIASATAAGPDAVPAAPAAPRAPQLDGQGLPYITLAQLLKKLSLVESGGAAKATVRAGGIKVNGEDETRPGRKLHQGDKVTIAGHDHKVDLAG